MSSLKSKIESLLLVSNQPLTFRQLANLTKADLNQIKEAARELVNDYNHRSDSGLKLLGDESKLQLVTASENAKLVGNFIKEETTGELTPASLQSLTIIAYRGPVTKAELEQIRGVNCAIILRNLMMRGLIERIENKTKMESRYQVTLDFLKFLGMINVAELPDYEKLRASENLEGILEPTS